MEWSEGGKWDNCNSIVNKYIFKNLSNLVNFCVAILIFNVKEKKQHFQYIMLYYFKKGKNATETHKDLCSAWRRCCD